MNKIFFALLLLVSMLYADAKTKIYDCFLFFNELELLEIRLNELYDHVDKFVLIESAETFRGNPKQLFFNENKHLFEKFLDKIIHVVVEGHFEANSAWDRETFQRNQIMRGLIDCNPDDMILISDVDEIIRASKITEIYATLSKIKDDNFKMVLLNQTLYRYFLNRFDKYDNPWPGSLAIFYKDLKLCSPEYCRKLAQRRLTSFVVHDAGWHFTYMGGHDRVKTKLAAFSHAECDTPANRDLQNLKNKIATYPIVKIDDSYPLFICNNLQKFINEGFVDLTLNDKA